MGLFFLTEIKRGVMWKLTRTSLHKGVNMATISTTKDSEIVGVFHSLNEWCLIAIQGLFFMLGGMGGCVILGTLLLPFVLIASFIIKLILILPSL